MTVPLIPSATWTPVANAEVWHNEGRAKTVADGWFRVRSETRATVPPPRTAPARTHPCELYAHSSPPYPIRTQFHHSRPVYLQNRLYGQIRYPADLWVCGLCHDSLHETIDWLLGEGRQPNPLPGQKTEREARRTVAWYRAELVAQA